MDRKQQKQIEDIEQNETELLPRNPYCSNEGAHCGCRFPNMTFQPQLVATKPWSLWKTFLVCLLACLIATTLLVLVLYFVHFGKPNGSGTTIIIHADGKSSHITCIPGSSLPPTSPTQPTPQSTVPSNTTVGQSSSTGVPLPALNTTVDHEIIIDDEI